MPDFLSRHKLESSNYIASVARQQPLKTHENAIGLACADQMNSGKERVSLKS